MTKKLNLLLAGLLLSMFVGTPLMMAQVLASSPTASGCEVCGEGDVQIQKVSYPYVNCSTMSNVFAFDVSGNQTAAGYSTILSEVAAMGHTVAVWNLSKDGAPPPCVKKLMIVSIRAGGSCLGYGGRNYTAAEAAIVAGWVSGGGRLMLLSEFSHCSGADEIVKALGYTPQPSPNMVEDSNDYITVDFWPIFQSDNFASHPVFQTGTPDEVHEVVFLASGWWTPNTGAIVLTDTDGTGTPSGVAVAAAFRYGSGKVFMTGDSSFLYDPAGTSFRDNLRLGRNAVLWLNDALHETVGGTLLSSGVGLFPWLLLVVLAVVPVIAVLKSRRTVRMSTAS